MTHMGIAKPRPVQLADGETVSPVMRLVREENVSTGQMKRPKFFEDLDRSLAGEPEPEETPHAPLAIVHDLAAKGRAIQAEEIMLEALARHTATGAMIAASQQAIVYSSN